jgi:hypothetical protein
MVVLPLSRQRMGFRAPLRSMPNIGFTQSDKYALGVTMPASD